jgi:hypothetical protein
LLIIVCPNLFDEIITGEGFNLSRYLKGISPKNGFDIYGKKYVEVFRTQAHKKEHGFP